ncbi:MAG: hypothetical protein GYB42_10995, partial [Alphaproteobacteria bacterium]|nr:hypothetical protein [Alphaproteobacteria bacterium]
DAAHLIPPNGGFNMNTGMQDAHNLAWKLAGVVKGWADERLLETYDAERRPIALFNAAEAVHNLTALVDKDDQGQAGGFRRDHYVHPGLALGYRYNNGAISYLPGQNREDDWTVGEYIQTAVPGGRAPHLWVTGKDGETISSLELFEREFVLLATPEGGTTWAAAVKEAAIETQAPLRLITIGEGGDWAAASEDFSKLYGLTGSQAVLVRPDGHVGWRGETADAAELAQAMDVLTGCPQMAHPA